MPLNQLQEQFYNRVVDLDFGKIILRANAGCGKTFVLTEAAAQLHRDGYRVLLCAPTHLARVNLLNKMPEDVRDFIETKTVASLLKRFGWTNDEGKLAFSAPTPEKLNDYDVIFVDEYSMISSRDADALLGSETKIVFSGDDAQLAPVLASKADFSDVEVFELTEQMRQGGVIFEAAEACREQIVYPSESIGPLTVHESTDDALQDFLSALSVLEPEDALNYRWLAQKNEEVVNIGEMARDVVYNSPADDFIAGEYILLYDTCAAGYNGQIVKVIESQPFTRISNSYDWKSYSVRVEGPRGEGTIVCASPADRLKIEAHINELSKTIKKLKKDAKFDEMKSFVAEVDYLNNTYTKVGRPFATTIHKSQGSSIPNVWVSTANFSRGGDKRALLYVALSRASETLHTVQVERPEWEYQRFANEVYRQAKILWEETQKEKHWNYRARTGLPASNPEQKEVIGLWMHINLQLMGFYRNALPVMIKM